MSIPGTWGSMALGHGGTSHPSIHAIENVEVFVDHDNSTDIDLRIVHIVYGETIIVVF